MGANLSATIAAYAADPTNVAAPVAIALQDAVKTLRYTEDTEILLQGACRKIYNAMVTDEEGAATSGGYDSDAYSSYSFIGSDDESPTTTPEPVAPATPEQPTHTPALFPENPPAPCAPPSPAATEAEEDPFDDDGERVIAEAVANGVKVRDFALTNVAPIEVRAPKVWDPRMPFYLYDYCRSRRGCLRFFMDPGTIGKLVALGWITSEELESYPAAKEIYEQEKDMKVYPWIVQDGLLPPTSEERVSMQAHKVIIAPVRAKVTAMAAMADVELDDDLIPVRQPGAEDHADISHATGAITHSEHRDGSAHETEERVTHEGAPSLRTTTAACSHETDTPRTPSPAAAPLTHPGAPRPTGERDARDASPSPRLTRRTRSDDNTATPSPSPRTKRARDDAIDAPEAKRQRSSPAAATPATPGPSRRRAVVPRMRRGGPLKRDSSFLCGDSMDVLRAPLPPRARATPPTQVANEAVEPTAAAAGEDDDNAATADAAAMPPPPPPVRHQPTPLKRSESMIWVPPPRRTKQKKGGAAEAPREPQMFYIRTADTPAGLPPPVDPASITTVDRRRGAPLRRHDTFYYKSPPPEEKERQKEKAKARRTMAARKSRKAPTAVLTLPSSSQSSEDSPPSSPSKRRRDSDDVGGRVAVKARLD